MKKIFTFLFAALMSASMFADPNILTPTISGDLSFTESTTVTMECTSPNSDIYYTTDGVTDPRCDCAAAPEYTHPITITETTIIKAAAYDGNDWSAVAEVTFTKVPAPAGPLFEISYEDKWLNIAPADAEAPYFLWLDSKAFYDGKYTEYTQEKMGGYMDYLVNVVNGANMTDLFLLSGEQKIAPNALLDSQGTSPYSLDEECIAFVFKYDSANKQRVSDVEYFVFTYAGEPEQEEGIENIVLTEKAQKVIMDGMIYIVRDGKIFDLTGAQVR